MSKEKDIDNILDECLDRMLANGDTVEECLSAYPGHAAELEPLLRTAVGARMAIEISPSAEFRERASHRFQAALREMETQKSSGLFGWQPRLVMPLAALAIIVLGGGGTVVAASGSLPDESLYQVKLATEAVRLAFTPSEIGKAELYVKLADERVDEIIEMAEDGKVAYVESTTQRLDGQLLAMSNNLGVPADIGSMQDGEALLEASPRMMMVEEAPADVPAPLSGKAPVEMPVMEDGVTASTPEDNGATVELTTPEIAELPPAGAGGGQEPVLEPAAESYEATNSAPEMPLPPPPMAAPAETPIRLPQLTAPGEVLTKDSDEWQGTFAAPESNGDIDPETALGMIISQQAIENTVALQQILDRVPEAARPALLRALEVASAGYKNALNKLR